MHPILFKLGPITIYTYGAIVALAFVTATFLMAKNAGRFGVEKNAVIDFMVVVFISGLVGARALHILVNFGYYKENPLEMIMITRGGLAIYGAILTAFPAGVIYLRKKGLPVWAFADMIAPCLALGQSIGRIGCYFNGCCYGIENFPFPVQILSSFILLAVYLILRFLQEKNIFKNNLIFIYFVLYSFQRFFVEFIRGDISRIYSGLTASQIISVFVFSGALVALLVRMAKCGNTNSR